MAAAEAAPVEAETAFESARAGGPGVINVVGLGPGPFDLLTTRTARVIESAARLILRTSRHPTARSLPDTLRWTALDDLDLGVESADSIEDAIAKRLLDLASEGDGLVYAVPGDASLTEPSIRRLVELAGTRGQNVRLIPGVSFPAADMAAGTSSLQIVDCRASFAINPLLPAILHGLSGHSTDALARPDLEKLYPADHLVTLLETDEIGLSARQVTLAELKQLTDLEHLAGIYLPELPPERALSSPFGLQGIVHRLRAPGGCPWDRRQTPASLSRFVLEEAHEVVDAIEDGEPRALSEELGDLLLQVYLQAEIAAEQGDFDLSDVIRAISEKLIRRHPHVFAELHVSGADEVELNWEQLKEAEKGVAESALDRMPRALPALARAQEVQRRLARAGFDWPDRAGALAKLDEELAELRLALADAEEGAAQSEFGDVLFMLAKLAQDDGIDAEAALRAATMRVDRRFRFVEQAVTNSGAAMKETGLDRLLDLWQQAKQAEAESKLTGQKKSSRPE